MSPPPLKLRVMSVKILMYIFTKAMAHRMRVLREKVKRREN